MLVLSDFFHVGGNRCFSVRSSLFVCVVFLFSVTGLFAGGSPETDGALSPRLRVSALNGPSGVLLSYVCRDGALAASSATGVPVEFTVDSGIDVLIPRFLRNEVDIAVLPVQVAAKLYTSHNKFLRFCAVTGTGMFYPVSGGTTVVPIQNLSDLAGKTVYCAGHGATPEYVMRYLLNVAGLTDSVTLDFSIRESEIAAAIAAGRITYAILPEPFVTAALAANHSLVRGTGLNTWWQESGQGGAFPVTALVVRAQYAAAHTEELDRFLDFCRQETPAVATHPNVAAAVAVQAGVTVNEAVLSAAVPFCNIVYIPAGDARSRIEELFQIFASVAPASIGGMLPEDGFYYAD